MDRGARIQTIDLPLLITGYCKENIGSKVSKTLRSGCRRACSFANLPKYQYNYQSHLAEKTGAPGHGYFLLVIYVTKCLETPCEPLCPLCIMEMPCERFWELCVSLHLPKYLCTRTICAKNIEKHLKNRKRREKVLKTRITFGGLSVECPP